MAIIAWILFGLVVGLIARALMPGRQSMGVVMTVILGIIGSLIGGFVGNALSGEGMQFSPSGIILSILGSMLLLFIAGAVTGPPRRVV